MTAKIRTTQLLLRPYCAADAPSLFGFMRDAAAMQHTYVAGTLEQCAARLAAFEKQRADLGFAPWVATAGSQQDIVGWGGLCVDLEEPAWGLEVIYAFAPAWWGRGLATELVRASLVFAFGHTAATEVHAYAKAANSASVRVLQKCGFTRLGHEPRLARDHYVVRSARP